MNEWLQRVLAQLRDLWQRWTTTQRLVLGGVVAVAVLAVILLFAFGASPAVVQLIGVPINDENQLARIVITLDEENVNYQLRADNTITVADEGTARRMRAILIREDLIPPQTDPWALFNVDRFSITDFERNVNLRRAITQNLVQHLEALDDVDVASVTLVVPEHQLFSEDQLPTTASIVITPRPNSDVLENRKKIEGMERLIQFAVAGLTGENIVILDHRGMQINNFADLAGLDRLALTQRQLDTKFRVEQQYKREILTSLARIFSPERVQIIKFDIALDLTQTTTQTEEHFPITLRQDNPLTPFDETDVVASITLSRQQSSESFEGTGFNPEGPPGQEGQTPPAYQDLNNLVGNYNRSSVTQNEAINKRSVLEEASPWAFQRITTSVAIDCVWRRVYDADGKVQFNPDRSTVRECQPVTDTDLAKASSLVRDAIGYDARRGDSVTVVHIAFDRTSQFEAEDDVFRRQAQVQRTLLAAILAIGAVLVIAVAYRYVSAQVERRRQREEELARQHQAMREAALRSAEEDGPSVAISTEDRAKVEIQEQAAALAREHPEDVAQLLRTWLVGE